MSSTEPVQARPAPAQRGASGPAYRYESRGDTWVMFAGTMLVLAGALNVVDGIAAIGNSAFFADGARYVVFNDLNGWGWILTLIGAVQVLTAIGVWQRLHAVRWVGVAVAAVNALAQFFFIQAYPLWSMTIIAMDILIIYGLVAYGARRD